jgi:hypothetical protein
VGETESQLPPPVTTAESVRFAPPPTVTDDGVGFALPTCHENASVVGVAVTVGAGVTVRLTGTDTTVPPFGATVMVAL